MRYMLNSDNGYGNTKLYNGNKFFEIPSLVCKEEDVSIIGDTTDTIDNMIAELRIGKEIKNIVVGRKAKQGRARYDFSTNKMDSPNTIYPAILGYAYILLNNNIRYATLDITTTLTIDDFKYPENIKKFEEVFLKDWEIKFKYGHLRNQNIHLSIKRNLTSAQGAVGIWDYALDDNSKLIVPLKGRKVLAIDIGFETTDICIMDNMMFDDENSQTIPIGMSDYNAKIVRFLNNKYRLRKTVEDSEEILKEGNLGAIDIKPIQDRFYKRMVEEIIQAISGIVPNTIEFSDIILLGGGAYKTFRFFKEHPEYERIIVNKQPHLSNVRGSRKLAQMIWRDTSYGQL